MTIANPTPIADQVDKLSLALLSQSRQPLPSALRIRIVADQLAKLAKNIRHLEETRTPFKP